MLWIIAAPFLLQGFLMFVDEFKFHRERGLPRWERLGHPLDTLTILVAFIFALNTTATSANILIYVGIALVSCLFVTKDEFLHSKMCKPHEQWLHSIMFMLHPLMFLALGFSWPVLHGEKFPFRGFELEKNSITFLMVIQTVTIGLFGLYQFVYWNFLWKEKK